MRFMNCMIDIAKCPLTLILTNSVKHEVMKMTERPVLYEVPNSGLGSFLDTSESLYTRICCRDML